LQVELHLIHSHNILVEVMMWSHQNLLLETLEMVLCADTVMIQSRGGKIFFFSEGPENTIRWTPGGTAVTAVHRV